MNFKNYIMLSSALVGITIGASAYAQTAPAPAASGSGKDDIVVVGIRKSLKKSLDIKRNTDAQVDVITAEGVGKFPDTNVAESLAHLPGIAVDRSYGEGEKITILGINSNLNKLLVDGHAIATADWGGNNDYWNDGRSFNYSMLAPELVGQAEVYKSAEARIDEGGVGGTVIVHTRRPLDLPANTFNASLGVSQNQKAGDQDRNPRGSLLYSWKDDAGKFGALVAYSYNKDNIGAERLGVFGLDTAGQYTDPTTGVKSNAYPNGIMAGDTVPASIVVNDWQQQRIRQTLSTDIQWKPSANWEFNLSGLAINGIYNNFSQSEYTWLDWQGRQGFQNVTVDNQGLVTGAYVPNSHVQLQEIYRKTAVANRTYDFSSKWTEGDWKVTADIGHTEAVSSADPIYLLNFDSDIADQFTFGRNGISEYFYNYETHTPFNPLTLGETGGQPGFIESQFLHDKEDFGQADAVLSTDWGPITKLYFGAKYGRHENNFEDIYYNVYESTSGPFTIASFDPYYTPSSWSSGLKAGGVASSYLLASKGAIINFLNANETQSLHNPVSRDWWVTEDTAAIYSEAAFRLDKWHGDFGVRVVNTKDILSWTSSDGETNPVDGSATPSYTKALPAINAVYDIEKDLLLRLTAGQVIARPQYNQLSGSQSVSYNSSTNQYTGGGGNPNLKPYEATNYTGSLEWYFAKDSLVSVDLFLRDVSSYIVEDQGYIQATYQGQKVNALWTSVFNADAAKVYGVSLAFQDALPFGFGIQTNVTYTNPDTSSSAAAGYGGKLTMPYLSNWLVNIIPYYENGPWTARLAYSFRSKYINYIAGGEDSQGAGSQNNVNIYQDQTYQLDASVTYKFTDHLSVNASAQNLGDPLQYVFQGNRDLPGGYTGSNFWHNGTKLAIGVSYKY